MPTRTPEQFFVREPNKESSHSRPHEAIHSKAAHSRDLETWVYQKSDYTLACSPMQLPDSLLQPLAHPPPHPPPQGPQGTRAAIPV